MKELDILYICSYGQTGLPICVDLEHTYCDLPNLNHKDCDLRPVVKYSDYEKLYKQFEQLKTTFDNIEEIAITLECDCAIRDILQLIKQTKGKIDENK